MGFIESFGSHARFLVVSIYAMRSQGHQGSRAYIQFDPEAQHKKTDWERRCTTGHGRMRKGDGSNKSWSRTSNCFFESGRAKEAEGVCVWVGENQIKETKTHEGEEGVEGWEGGGYLG